MYIVTLMTDVDDDGMMANVDMIINIKKVVKNCCAITDFLMSAEDFHCDVDGCNLHYIEPCDICTKCFCEECSPMTTPVNPIHQFFENLLINSTSLTVY